MSTVEVTLPENTTTEETEVKDTEISEEQGGCSRVTRRCP